MPWDEQSSFSSVDDLAIDRLSLAAPLLGATGWIDGLARLVGIEPAGHDAPLVSTLQDMFAPLGFNLRRIAPDSPDCENPAAPGAQASLVAARRTGRPTCSIHIPLGPASMETGWTRPPHQLTRRGNRLYGCGTREGKGAIAAVWAALRAADAVGLPLRFDPVLLFTTDSPGRCGLGHLTGLGEVKGHLLSLDGVAAPRVWAGSLGQVMVEIRIAGASTAEAALPVLSRLTALQHQVAQRQSRLPPEPEAGLASLGAQLSIVSVSTTAKPGEAPACTLVVQRRYTPEEGGEAPLAELRAALAAGAGERPGCTVESRVLRHRPAAQLPEEGPNGARWQQALSWGFGYPPGAFRRCGGLEPSAFCAVQAAGVREILVGGLTRPGQRRRAPDEFTTVEDVESLARAVLAYLAETATD